MVRQTAERFNVNPTSRWSWVPVTALSLTFLLAIIGFARSFGYVEGRTGTEAQQLLTAADKIEKSMNTMRSELMSEVSSIRGSVATAQRQVDRLEAQQDVLRDENKRLLQLLDTEALKRENLERRIRAAGTRLE